MLDSGGLYTNGVSLNQGGTHTCLIVHCSKPECAHVCVNDIH